MLGVARHVPHRVDVRERAAALRGRLEVELVTARVRARVRVRDRVRVSDRVRVRVRDRVRVRVRDRVRARFSCSSSGWVAI